MGISSMTLTSLKQEILSTDATIFQHLDSAGVYSDYLMKSRQMVKKLHGMQVRFSNRGQWTALVAAIKQEKDIYDSCIKFGQDFGYIEKKAASLDISGEMIFSSSSPEEIRDEIKRQAQELNDLATGKPILMRPELIGLADGDVKKFVPANVAALPAPAKKKSKTKVKIKTKVRLRKNF